MTYLLLIAFCCYLIRGWWKADDKISVLEKQLTKADGDLCAEKRDNDHRQDRLRQSISRKEEKIRELEIEICNIHKKYKAEKQGERYSLSELVGLKPGRKETQ